MTIEDMQSAILDALRGNSLTDKELYNHVCNKKGWVKKSATIAVFVQALTVLLRENTIYTNTYSGSGIERIKATDCSLKNPEATEPDFSNQTFWGDKEKLDFIFD